MRSRKDAGASPLFPPKHENAEQARRGLLRIVRTSPDEHGYQRSRWSLEALRQQADWLELETDAGMWQVLDRVGITYQRGQSFVRSPDEHFDEKCDYIERVRSRVAEEDEQVGLYLDELQYFQQPAIERGWGQQGEQPTVDRPATSKYEWSHHVLSAIDCQQGNLFWRHRDSFDRETFQQLYRDIAEAYPEAEHIWLIQDNLPVHFHIEVLELLESQKWPWDFPAPPTWPDPAEAAQRDGPLPIQLTPLPTYASWLNPVERFWRNLKRQVLYLQPNGCQPEQLVAEVDAYLNSQANSPDEVLSATGLSCG